MLPKITITGFAALISFALMAQKFKMNSSNAVAVLASADSKLFTHTNLLPFSDQIKSIRQGNQGLPVQNFPASNHNEDTVPMLMPPSAMAASFPMVVPGMAGPLQANPRPFGYNLGRLGSVYINGVISAIGQWQNNKFPDDRKFQADLSNAQIFIQKVDGFFQFFIQAGSYSLPALGVPYLRAGNTKNSSGSATNAFYGVIPQAFVKLVPFNNFSIMAGKLPTLVGAEYTFSFENMNIQRGLLWNQENAVNKGIQANFTKGQLTLAASWNDGMYSNRYTWGWFSAVYAVNSRNTLAFVGGGNTKATNISTSATPLYLNNEQIYNLIYTHTSGKWTIEPYFQYTSVPKKELLQTTSNASTYGAALFLNYKAVADENENSLYFPVRLEYIKSTGSTTGAPNLLYGQGSGAWSFTLTPTYQYKRIFTRAEFSFVKASGIINGLAFGSDGTKTLQARALLEVGLLF